jgi:hypothetical protein
MADRSNPIVMIDVSPAPCRNAAKFDRPGQAKRQRSAALGTGSPSD